MVNNRNLYRYSNEDRVEYLQPIIIPNHDVVLGIVNYDSNTKIHIINPTNEKFNPSITDIWLAMGQQVALYENQQRYGLIHILYGHTYDFSLCSKNSPELIVEFIFNTLLTQTGIVCNDQGRVIYPFRLRDDIEGNIRFLVIGIDGDPNKLKNCGRIHTSFVVHPGDTHPNDWDYDNYIKFLEDYIPNFDQYIFSL